MARIRLKSYEFRREREGAWRKLEELVRRVNKRGLRDLSGQEILRLPRLYRSTVSSLSVARTISLDKNLLGYLEGLSQRAFFCVYDVRRHLRDVIASFFTTDFPRAVRRFRWHVALAAFTLVAGAVAGFLLTARDADRFYAFVPEGIAGDRGPQASTRHLRETLYDGGHETSGLGVFSSFLFTHNAKVGMLCFAIGFVAGIPVFLLLFTTGLMLGAFWALFASRGLGPDFLGWVSPHGVTELLAIVLCGAAGLVMAEALVFPGRLSRLKNLARQSRRAGILVIGTIPMFLVAGLLEGFFRQMVTDMSTRFVVAAITALFWLGYLTRAGRGGRPA